MGDRFVFAGPHAIIGNDSLVGFGTTMDQLHSSDNLPPLGTQLCARLDANCIADVSAQLS